MAVSATTRAPRPGEADGREYHFVGRTEFEEAVAGGRMLELNWHGRGAEARS